MKIVIHIFCLLLFCQTLASEPAKEKSVCLNMIVKNETKVIERCLASVKPLIDYWVIVDTGSTDGTQDKIKQFMADIPGELHERPWLNFEHNRNEALQLAKDKADYLLFIDADEIFAFDDSFKLSGLDADCYYITTEYGGTSYARMQLIKSSLDWKWVGVLHEALQSTQARSLKTLAGIKNIVHTDGCRSADPQKYQKDALVLEKALEKEPTNARYMFYLAQSYMDGGDYAKALKVYQKRVDMKGWNQEVFCALLRIAHLKRQLDESPLSIVFSYLKAYRYRPLRVEPLHYLASYFQQNGEYALAYFFTQRARRLPRSSDVLFVETWIYDYGLQLEQAVNTYWMGLYAESERLSSQVLVKDNLPSQIRQLVENNLAFAKAKRRENQPLVLVLGRVVN